MKKTQIPIRDVEKNRVKALASAEGRMAQ